MKKLFLIAFIATSCGGKMEDPIDHWNPTKPFYIIHKTANDNPPHFFIQYRDANGKGYFMDVSWAEGDKYNVGDTIK